METSTFRISRADYYSGVLRLTTTAVFALGCAACGVAAQAPSEPPAGAAYLVRSLSNGSVASQSRPEILDTPLLPGSIAKAATLVAALESGVITPATTRLCRRTVTVDGRTYACTHPDLKRPLTPAEALAHSCNDFFVSLAPWLSREAVNAVRVKAGLGAVAASSPFAASLVGLDGPRIAPRLMIDAVARLAGAGTGTPVPMRATTRTVLLEGMRGAAEYGTASALRASGVSALAKTGTAPMPGGGAMGLVVALSPAMTPTRGAVVVVPGAAGLDAAAVAADLLEGTGADTIRLGRSGPNSRIAIERVPIDDYVAQVIAGESAPDAGAAAQQALAITARTYGLANRGRHGAEGFDLCDTTHCQAVRPPTARARAAAAATAGRVLLVRGALAPVFHSAWCGGHPERPSDVWPGTPDDAGAAWRDDECLDVPGWTSELRAADLERAFAAAGMRGGTLRALRVAARNRTGRVARIEVDGWSPSTLSGQEFRTIVGRQLGWQHVKSTLFDLERTANGYRLTGRGFGHGAGLCVLGAGRRAARGATAEAILAVYFPDASIGATPPAQGGDDKDVELRLPATEANERSPLIALLRRTRDSIAAAAGVPAPAVLRVTVHPTVDSFGRATGQPWHVAGASGPGGIDLLPLTALRRDGQLERVVRHEVAHAVVDQLLQKRPLWVREGAAAYFAAPQEAGEVTSAACPADAELRRPVSAAAQRQAYARAEMCFRRALARGVGWRDVQ
jgi:stage II sporulation protein D